MSGITTEHQQRLELVGRMATGIAHDLNNQMMLILNHLDLALAQIPATNDVRGNITDVKSAAGRCAEMIGSILTFGSPSKGRLQLIDLTEALAETARLLRRTIPANIDIRFAIDSGLNSILADATQIQQILINMALNSRDAMPGGGRLVIEARNHEGGVSLKICDNGLGMKTEVQRRMFEPYFTMKGEAGGTGLGLAIVADLVRKHGGQIRTESVSGKGTCFLIVFPCHNVK